MPEPNDTRPEIAPVPPPLAPPVRSFDRFLAEIEDGAFVADLSEDLRKTVSAIVDVAAHGRKGRAKLTVTLDLACEDNGLVEIRADYKAKLPTVARGRTVFWATPENNLSRSNPRQHALPLHDVNRPAAAPRTVA